MKVESRTDIVKKQYQKFDNIFDFDKLIKKEKQTTKKYNRSSPIYDSKYSFYLYYNIKNFNSPSLTSKHPIFLSFNNELNKFNSLNPWKGCTKDKKATLYNNASELYNEYLENYYDQYMDLSDAKKRKFDDMYDPEELFLEEYDYSVPPLEGDEEVKEGKGLKILTPNKLLTRLPIY